MVDKFTYICLNINIKVFELYINDFLWAPSEYNSVVCISVVIPRYIVNITSPSHKYLEVCVSLDSIGEMSGECLVIVPTFEHITMV